MQTLSEQVEEFKKQGNAEFTKQNYDAAITFYTQALSMCPQSEKGLLSTVFQNRAAAYSKLVKNNYLLLTCYFNQMFIKYIFHTNFRTIMKIVWLTVTKL